jgi:integrase
MGRPPKPWYRAQTDAWFVTLDGKQHRLAEGKKARAEAEAAFHRLMAAAKPEAEPTRPRGALSAAAGLDLFLGHARRRLRPRTAEWYAWYLTPLAAHLKATPLPEVRPHHLTAWLDGHPAWNDQTRRGAIVAASRALNWCVTEGYAESNPLKGYKKPRARRRSVADQATSDAKIAALPPGPFRDFALGLRWTGCRPGELAGLLGSDVAPDGRSIRVRGKTGERVLPIGARASELIRGLAAQRGSGLLFLNSRGEPWNRNAWRCRFRKLGLVAYGMRHSFGTSGVRAGVNPLDLARIMGHRDLKMLHEFYYSADPGSLSDAADKAGG